MSIRHSSIQLCFILLLLHAGTSFGNTLDSLRYIKANMQGKARVDAIVRIIDENSIIDLGDALVPYLEDAIHICRQEGYQKGLAEALLDLGVFHSVRRDDFFSAREALEESVELFKSLDAKPQLMLAHRLVGNVNKDQGNLTDALNHYLEALKLAEDTKDVNEQARTLGSIGLVYKNQEKYKDALEYFNQALSLLQQDPDKDIDEEAVAITYTNMGLCESSLGEYDKALEFYKKALSIDQTLQSEAGIAYDYFAIAEVYEKMGNDKDALAYIGKSIEMFLALDDQGSVMGCRIVQAKLYKRLGMHEKSLDILHSTLASLAQMELKPLMRQVYEQLYLIYDDMGEPVKAYDYFKKYIAVRDSIASTEVSDSIERMRSAYDAEKKAQEIERLKVESALQQERIDNQNQLAIFGAFGTLLLLILLAVIYGRYQLKQKANEQLSAQNQLIEYANAQLAFKKDALEAANIQMAEQKREVEVANEKVLASIRYGSRIQNALIAAGEPIIQAFPQSFVLLRPKDIVSGDFYWYVNRGDEQIIAAIDCTGHGVPGAFLTVFGYSLLNKIVNNDGISEPAKVLEMLGKEIARLFQTQDEDQLIQDGMDMAYVRINRKEKLLQFAGADRPMILQTAQGQQFIKGDRMGLGGDRVFDRLEPFATFEHRYEAGDTFYIFSDGYADQFGGPNEERRKFMGKNFKALIENIQPYDMATQRNMLERALLDWMGAEKQTDDIIVIGVKLTE
jgi:tetratricopeptide (TPR) repeat protein